MHPVLAVLPDLVGHAKRPLFLLLLGFIFTFVVVRINTRRVRARGGAGTGAGSIVTPGGLHIHHSVFGIITMVVAGILEFALQPGIPYQEMIAVAFGAGAALTLDEFALILHLEDVYWTGEGRASIDAVILGITFMTLLLTGLVPLGLDGFGDVIVLSRLAGVAVVLVTVVFVVVCYLKGKLFTGTVGIFIPPVALVGAIRLGKPSSPWAHLRYARNPVKLERARRRDEGFNRRWLERKHRLWDVIGGRPHLHLSHRLTHISAHVHREAEPPGPRAASPAEAPPAAAPSPAVSAVPAEAPPAAASPPSVAVSPPGEAGSRAEPQRRGEPLTLR
jgi:lysyl-tRNA synthetase, class II